MKKLVFLMFMLFSSLCLATSQEVLDVRMRMAESVTYIQNSKGSCTATFVNFRNSVRLLTNAHCCIEDTIMVFNGDKVDVKVVKKDVEYDLCELENKFENKGFNFSPKVFPLGDTYSVGYPNSTFNLSKGILQIVYPNVISPTKVAFVVVSDSLAYPGISGGALLNDKGELIAIVNKYQQFANRSIGIGAPTVLDFLLTNEKVTSINRNSEGSFVLDILKVYKNK